MTPVSLTTLYACYQGAQRAGCVYSWGAKPGLNWDSSLVLKADCSGMSRWLIARATNQAVIIPEGSVDQHAWFDASGLHKLNQYADIHYTINDPGRLFIAFHNPEPVGHVIICHAGRTLEAHGPRGNPLGGRSWDDSILVRCMDSAYEIPCIS